MARYVTEAQSRVIRAVRAGYTAARALPDGASEHVRNIREAWEGGETRDVAIALGALQHALGSVPGAYDHWERMRDAASWLLYGNAPESTYSIG